MIRQVVVDARPGLERHPHHDLARLQRGEGHAVAVEDGVAEHRRHPRPRRQDADEVERIGGGDPAQLGQRRRRAQGAQLVESLGQRELLADEAVDEGIRERSSGWALLVVGGRTRSSHSDKSVLIRVFIRQF